MATLFLSIYLLYDNLATNDAGLQYICTAQFLRDASEGTQQLIRKQRFI